MANPTTNYGFVLPTPSDLVTDLPADFEVALQGVDTQMKTNADAAIAKSIVDAKGDIVAATAADTVTRLAVGANNTVLTADSSTATGLKWAAAAGGGKILQVVNTIVAAVRTTTSTTFVDITGASATITPSSASSKVLAIANLPAAYVSTTGGTGYAFVNTVRGSTEISQGMTGKYVSGGSGGTLVGDIYSGITMVTYDSPATTSATTYKLQFKQAGGFTFYASDSANFPISLTLMEIGA